MAILTQQTLKECHVEMERCIKRDRRVRTCLTKVLVRLAPDGPLDSEHVDRPLCEEIAVLIQDIVYSRYLP